MMEIQQWAIQLKSHAMAAMTVLTKSQNSLQLETYDIAGCILFFYAAILFVNKKASRAYCFLAFLICAVIARSPAYSILDAVQYHSLFAIIYLSVTYKVKPIKAKVACCLLGSFQIIMAWDSYINAQIETFIWLHYEVIVCLLHALIIGSFLERDAERIKRHLGRFASFVRHLLSYSCNRLCLWYY